AVSQLAVEVTPPAIRGAVRRDPAGVITRTDRREREPAGHGNRYVTVRRRAVPQLAEAVEPPAIRGAAERDPTGLILAGAHAHGRDAHGHDDIERAARGAREAGRGRGQRVARSEERRVGKEGG